MCYCPDEGSSEFYSRTHPRARKAHRCEECRRVILPGERYARHSQKWEGDVSSWPTCAQCDAWSSAFARASRIVCGCSGHVVGEMWEQIAEFAREHLGYDPSLEDPEDVADFCGELDPKLRGFTLEARA
jgi:hypothetical protein